MTNEDLILIGFDAARAVDSDGGVAAEKWLIAAEVEDVSDPGVVEAAVLAAFQAHGGVVIDLAVVVNEGTWQLFVAHLIDVRVDERLIGRGHDHAQIVGLSAAGQDEAGGIVIPWNDGAGIRAGGGEQRGGAK